MLGTDVAAEKSHTIRASESKDTAGAGLSSGEFDCTVSREFLYDHQFIDLPRGHVASSQ